MLEQLTDFFASWFANININPPYIDYASMFQIDPWLVVLGAIAIAAFLVITVVLVIRAHRRGVSAGREDLIGRTAEVKTALNPKGTILIEGEHWTAVSEDGRAEPGDEVVITKVDHLTVWVTISK
ncbi:MAG: NfeD family protein [Dehalococcoidia bacterium]|nr:NfeD family protein [Dehalococcoidia bacterium]